ncbi:MAG TPA: DUF1643 domain-containing protein [Planctomycetota bacterium]|nr:DUF1643 domain-containing protein [Planctomycetota bacterium]
MCHNPSIAGKEFDDPSCTRMISFTAGFGFGSLVLVNLVPFISTDPRGIPTREESVPDENGQWVMGAIEESSIVVAGWGVLRPPWDDWAQEMLAFMREFRPRLEVFCLGLTKNGFPRHPLYVHSKTELERYC